MRYRIEFKVSRDDGLNVSDSYEFEPSDHDARDSWAIAADMGSYVTSVADGAVWGWFALRTPREAL